MQPPPISGHRPIDKYETDQKTFRSSDDSKVFYGRSSNHPMTYHHIELGSGDSEHYFHPKDHSPDTLAGKKICTIPEPKKNTPLTDIQQNNSIHHDRFSVLEWTLKHLIRVTRLNTFETHRELDLATTACSQLIFYLNGDGRQQARLHLRNYIQRHHQQLAERIHFNDLVVSTNNEIPLNALKKIEPDSIYVTFSYGIIPNTDSDDAHREHLQKKLKTITELCTSNKNKELLYIYDALKEPEIYALAEPEITHPFEQTITGQAQSFKDECFKDDGIPSIPFDTIKLALFKPCPCLSGKQCPGNPRNDLITDDDDSGSESDNDDSDSNSIASEENPDLSMITRFYDENPNICSFFYSSGNDSSDNELA